jgi:GNAT superfamily N-acetyltransferase
MHYEVKQGEFVISADPTRLDFDEIYSFLSNTYWARERPRRVMKAALKHSCCFGMYHGCHQIGFARAVTDYATYGYLADVYVLEPYRGRGLGHWLVKTVLEHPELKHLRRWGLVTRDSQSLYRDCGFTALEHPEHHMQKLQPYPKE